MLIKILTLDNPSNLVNSKSKDRAYFISVKPDEVWDSKPYRIVAVSYLKDLHYDLNFVKDPSMKRMN